MNANGIVAASTKATVSSAHALGRSQGPRKKCIPEGPALADFLAKHTHMESIKTGRGELHECSCPDRPV